ncbi:acyl-CoA dehydratase activase [Chloroflexota bacterium]
MSTKAIGLDIGSQTTKAVILDGNEILSSTITQSQDDPESSAKAAVEQVLGQVSSGSSNDLFITSTGIGGKSITLNQQHKGITTCLARGVHHLFPSAQMVIDMGAESGTVLRINERGRLSDWATHDKCAAGTGIFLQQMAKLMQMSLEEMSEISYQAKSKADISSTCAVFAESEVISHVHRVPPTPREDIAAGIYYSVVSRTVTLCKRVGIKEDIAAVGGVALNKGLLHILEKEIGSKILVPDTPQIAAALGAAIISQENIEKGAL